MSLPPGYNPVAGSLRKTRQRRSQSIGSEANSNGLGATTAPASAPLPRRPPPPQRPPWSTVLPQRPEWVDADRGGSAVADRTSSKRRRSPSRPNAPSTSTSNSNNHSHSHNHAYAQRHLSTPSRPPIPTRPRSRTRSLTPPPPGSPTPSYITLTLDPSTSNPTPQRKLLVLDLNGALVLRSPRRAGAGARAVFPRPYLPALRAYLFHPAIAPALDVMVWSSAQPHSVADMVGHAFGPDREKLVAVWARDTLDLPPGAYNRKIQTVKDLRKPWAALPSILHPVLADAPPSPASSHASLASSTRSTPPPHPPTSSSSPLAKTSTSTAPPPSSDDAAPVIHTALSTLLIDDSPRKAVLQPYNHLCIPEYSRERRNADLAALTRAAARPRLNATRKAVEVAQKAEEARGDVVHGTPEPGEVNEDEIEIDGEGEAEVVNGEPAAGSPRPKREKKREMKRARLLAAAQAATGASESENADAGEGEDEGEGIDETLLAVVGILHALRGESNVAGWIRAGGLWRGKTLEGVGERGDGGAGEEGHVEGRPMWFEDPETVSAWIGEGKRALGELGVEIEHGVLR